MFGVLVDVSESMKEAYALNELHHDDVSVERTHAVFTTIAKIVEREVTHHDRRESIFACAFGMNNRVENINVICNLIELLVNLRYFNTGREELIRLAKQYGASHAEEWIRDYLTNEEAAALNWLLREDESLIPIILGKLPNARTASAVELKCKVNDSVKNTKKKIMNGIGMITGFTMIHRAFRAGSPSPPPPPETSWDQAVKSSEAYAFVKKIISEKSVAFSDILVRPIEPRSVQYVSRLMVDLMESGLNAGKSSTKEQHDYIQELIDIISPFIYGHTPMCQAMEEALRIFKQADPDTAKVLFILSDGQATDGNPVPIAQELRALGVRIVTCYLTSDHIDNPKCLVDEPNPNWDGQRTLFEMSSTMKNTHTPISYLVDAGWELPPSGECRLFVQANSLNIVNELCEIVVSRMTEGCDALVDALGKVDLATYINQANAGFIPRDQHGEATCYAHAIAATFHLAMHRIVGREGGVPDFNTIRDRLIQEYGQDVVNGINTVHVLEAVCPEYRLRYKAVTETDARKAINERRPVVARFRLYLKQWDKFVQFFSDKRKKILERSDLESSE